MATKTDLSDTIQRLWSDYKLPIAGTAIGALAGSLNRRNRKVSAVLGALLGGLSGETARRVVQAIEESKIPVGRELYGITTPTPLGRGVKAILTTPREHSHESLEPVILERDILRRGLGGKEAEPGRPGVPSFLIYGHGGGSSNLGFVSPTSGYSEFKVAKKTPDEVADIIGAAVKDTPRYDLILRTCNWQGGCDDLLDSLKKKGIHLPERVERGPVMSYHNFADPRLPAFDTKTGLPITDEDNQLAMRSVGKSLQKMYATGYGTWPKGMLSDTRRDSREQKELEGIAERVLADEKPFQKVLQRLLKSDSRQANDALKLLRSRLQEHLKEFPEEGMTLDEIAKEKYKGSPYVPERGRTFTSPPGLPHQLRTDLIEALRRTMLTNEDTTRRRIFEETQNFAGMLLPRKLGILLSKDEANLFDKSIDIYDKLRQSGSSSMEALDKVEKEVPGSKDVLIKAIAKGFLLASTSKSQGEGLV